MTFYQYLLFNEHKHFSLWELLYVDVWHERLNKYVHAV